MSKIKDKIDAILEIYGSDVTHRVITFDSDFDQWGQPVQDSTSDSAVKAVKDNNFVKKIILAAGGKIPDGSSALIIKADVTIDIETSRLIYDGQTYSVTNVESLELSGEKLAQIVQIGLDSSN